VFFPVGQDPQRIIDSLAKRDAPGLGLPYEAFAVELPGPSVLTPIPANPPTLHDWIVGAATGGINVTPGSHSGQQSGSSSAHGPTVPGGQSAQPEDRLTYFTYPYTPWPGDPDIGSFQNCLQRPLPVIVATHSPVALLATDNYGNRVGTDGSGHHYGEVPGAFVTRGGDVTYTVMPYAAYTVDVSATDNGRATVVVYGYPGNPPQRSVFSLDVRRGDRGKLTLPGNPPRQLDFAGKTVQAKVGVAMSVLLDQGAITAGTSNSVRVTVKDQFGQPVPRAAVEMRDDIVKISSITDTHGQAKLRIDTIQPGAHAINVSATGYAPATANLTVNGAALLGNRGLGATPPPVQNTGGSSSAPIVIVVLLLVAAAGGYLYWRRRTAAP
jgi:LPXTG-motif cell wall-anchored protein